MNGTEQNPPIERVIKLGCVPRLVSFLPQAGNPKLQFEAAWALTNIASGNSDQTMVLLQFVRPIPIPSLSPHILFSRYLYLLQTI